MDDLLLREGIAAARSGQRERARDLLTRVVEQDEKNVPAWLWLSSVVDSLEDREICLENVLALDPTHDAARQGLAWVRKQMGASAPSEPDSMPASSPPQAPSPADPAPARVPVSAAAAILHEDFARRRPPPEAKSEPPPMPLRDELEDEYLCPYCAAQTTPDDRVCPTCGQELWIKMRRREERSSWLWVALTLQAASIIWPAFVSLIALFYAGRQADLDNFFRLAPAYLGLPTDVPPETASAAFDTIPRLYALPLVVYILFSLAMTIGLYLRWKPIFYLYLVNALLILSSAIAALAIDLGQSGDGIAVNQNVGVICSVGGLLLGLLLVLLVLKLEDDFFFDQKRLLLRLDRDATNGPALMLSAKHYAKRGMWALAAIHLRRAIVDMPDQIDPHLALAVAYLHLKRPDQAASALEQARRISPNNPQVEHLTVLLDSQRAAESISGGI